MSSRKQTLLALVFLIGIFGLLTFGIHRALAGNALGFDYMFYWHAGRALFLEDKSPYSPEVTERIQMSIYGRPALPDEYPYPFPYPLPILFISLPFYFFSYDWSQAAWMALNVLAPVTTAVFLFPRAPKWLNLTLILFYPISFTIIIGNYSLLIGVILIAVLYGLFFSERTNVPLDILGGLGLAWAIHKPQMVWMMVAFILIAVLRKRRFGLLGGFFGGVFLLNLIGFALQPDWLASWIHNAVIYPQNSGHVPALVAYLEYILPPAAARISALVLAVSIAILTVWFLLRWWQGRRPDLEMIAWCAFVTSLVDISALTPDQIILLVPFFLWAARQSSSRALKWTWFGAIAATYVCFGLTKMEIIPLAVSQGPFLMYTLWMVLSRLRIRRSKFASRAA